MKTTPSWLRFDRSMAPDVAVILLCVAVVIGLALLTGCGGQSGSDRDCVAQPGTSTQITDRIVLAQCGDGSITICSDGACGGTSDSGNTTENNPTSDSNNTTDTRNTTNNELPRGG